MYCHYRRIKVTLVFSYIEEVLYINVPHFQHSFVSSQGRHFLSGKRLNHAVPCFPIILQYSLNHDKYLFHICIPVIQKLIIYIILLIF